MARTEPGQVNRRGFIIATTAAAATLAAPSRANDFLRLKGAIVQGGYVVGRTAPGAEIFVDGQSMSVASAAGRFVVGFDRDAPAQTVIEARTREQTGSAPLRIARGDFDEQRIDGLPPDQVSPAAPALLERIAREVERKNQALRSRDPSDGFADGFIWPLEQFRRSARFGGRRILNGEPKRPHYGVDLAAPTGTPIRAPAPGLVVLAEPDMHFEGGLVMIDHGQGLISFYLHQSRLLVRAGERVDRGRILGEVGATGRATGPHLCWRLRWRDRNLDPGLWVAPTAT
jgi:murein DD-endopeptidase MepM/ murein hydrolase activator NlpD